MLQFLEKASSLVKRCRGRRSLLCGWTPSTAARQQGCSCPKATRAAELSPDEAGGAETGRAPRSSRVTELLN